VTLQQMANLASYLAFRCCETSLLAGLAALPLWEAACWVMATVLSSLRLSLGIGALAILYR
jgi:hypothetical protein